MLLVDDDESFLSVTEAFLSRSDVDVAAESDPERALDRVVGEEFECVVSDYEMPGKDGIEFLREVRQRDDDMPFVLLTGKGDEEVASQAISAGVTDYIQKDVGTHWYEMLARRIWGAVGRDRAREHVKEIHQRFEKILEASPDGIVVSVNNEFVYANAAAVELYGAENKEEFLGTSPLDFIHPDYRDEV
ncbi:MAG: response regulator, partial [Halobacteria archaeon]|nr:response regulator [Halobacteria archaeon]